MLEAAMTDTSGANRLPLIRQARKRNCTSLIVFEDMIAQSTRFGHGVRRLRSAEPRHSPNRRHQFLVRLRLLDSHAQVVELRLQFSQLALARFQDLAVPRPKRVQAVEMRRDFVEDDLSGSEFLPAGCIAAGMVSRRAPPILSRIACPPCSLS